MFCARCGVQVGAHEVTCPRCHLDLRLPGAVRMTDPAATPGAPGGPDVPGGSGAGDETVVLGSGSHPAPVPEDEAPTQQMPTVGGASAATGGPGGQRYSTGPTVVQPWSSQQSDATRQMPSDWFRDPEAERTRAMATVPQQPVFTPPPVPPSAPFQAPPGPPQPESGRHRTAIIVLVVVIVALLVVGSVLLALGSFRDSSGSKALATPSVSATSTSTETPLSEETSTDADESSTQSADEEPSDSTSGEPSESESAESRESSNSTGHSTGPLPDGDKMCSDSVGAQGTTSCPFALNVAAAIPSDASGTYKVEAYSPTTGKSYVMQCVHGEQYTTCTGGVAAVVHVLR